MDWVRSAEKLRLLLESDCLWVLYGEAVLFRYYVGTDRARPFCHPVCTLGGDVLTLDAPHDHLHHNGFYMAHGEVNGCNFWVDPDLPEPPDYQPKVRGRIVHEAFEKAFCDSDRVEFIAKGIWLDQAGGVVLRETRQVQVWAPTDFSRWWMDWGFRWEAGAQAVVFGTGSTYHGLSFRTARSLDRGRILNSEGGEGVQECDGIPARWCAYTGSLDGRRGSATFVLMDHPANPRHPTPFFCMNEPFGFLATAFSRHEPFTIPPRESVIFRYRALIQKGDPDEEGIERLFQGFALE